MVIYNLEGDTMTRKYCATTATVDSGNLVLTFANTPVFSNTRKFCFYICPNIVNTSTAVLPVVVNVNISGTVAAVPLWDRFGNIVYSNTLKKGVDYFGYMGSVTDEHVIIYNTPCC